MNSVLFFTLALLPLLYYAISIIHSPLFPTQNSDHRKKLEALLIPGAIGPESVAFDSLGDGPYVGISDGRIIKWSHHKRHWTNFSTISHHREGCEGAHDHHQTEHICGRPLGMCFNERTGELYIADAYLGLRKVGPEGGVSTPIATHAQGATIGFTNGLDINHSDGTIYFTDSSSLHQRRNYISLILSGDRTGRLMKYDPQSQQVIVLLENLSFPNGVALSEDGSYLILAETTYCRILRYWLKTSKAGTVEVFAQLPGFPDNIKRSPRGGYWVAMHTRRLMITGWIISNPWIGNALLKLPIDIMKAYAVFSKYTGSGLAVRLSEDGDVLETLEDKIGNRIRSLSEVQEKDGVLWIGSIAMPFLGMYKM
ncbi:hypothetical protein SLA2020_036350 [Shorea laevis]